MESDNDDLDDSWNKLKSINQFDRYNDGLITTVGSTQIVGGSLIESVASKATTPVSLLVESLVQQICAMLDRDPIRSKQLYNTICEQLHQMNIIDNTYDMGEFDMMRNQYQRALYQLVSVARGQDMPPLLQSVWPLSQPIGMDWSRYYREFEELNFIAGGGFGKVYKARNKLDDSIYAVKKITIKKTDVERVLTHLREVKTLAALHHINIVPYKAAWLEPLLADTNDNCSIENTCDQMDESEYSTQTSDGNGIFKMDASSDNFTFERSKTCDGENKDDDSQSEAVNTDAQSVLCKYSKQIQFSNQQPHLRLKWATLFIQMSLCQLTLREWLNNRNKASTLDEFYKDFVENCPIRSERRFLYRRSSSSSSAGSENSKEKFSHSEITATIMTQLLNGLEYIHSKGIIHHDIKPSNIFIGIESDGRILVQLGDFGLACPLQDQHTEVVAGTPAYAAPEQLNGICNPKSDIYSLGIVLIELLIVFNTDMERIRTIEAARAGRVPDEIPTKFKPLVKNMLRYQPSKRPDIAETIEIMNNITISKQQSTEDLQQQLKELSSEITNLRNKLKNDEILDCEIRARESEIKIKNEQLRIKDREIEKLQLQIMKMETRTTEVMSKDEEINRLRELLSVYESKAGNSL